MSPIELPSVVGRGLIRALIRTYQILLSPFIGNQCRFHPSCSNYALDAVERHGAIRGSWLAIKRLGRCHPLHPGGFDPVPGAATDDAAPSSQHAASAVPRET